MYFLFFFTILCSHCRSHERLSSTPMVLWLYVPQPPNGPEKDEGYRKLEEGRGREEEASRKKSL